MAQQLQPSPASIVTADMSEARPRDMYRRFFEHSLQLLCVADESGRFKHLNPRWQEVLGYDLAYLKAHPMISFVHPDDREGALAEARRIFDGGGDTVRYENRFRTARGGYRWLRWSARADPETRTFLATAQDVTDVRHSTERFRIAVEAAPAGMLIVDAVGRIVLANAQLEATFGYARGELDGTELDALVPLPARGHHHAHRRAYLTQPETRRMGDKTSIEGQRKDGSRVPLDVGLTRFDLDGETFVLATVVDITETIAQRRELELAKEVAERSRAALEQEERAAAKLYDRITSGNEQAPACVRSYASPHSVFNGDTLLIAQCPSGNLRVLLGDFTGHGLTAAIGGLPMAESFRAMTRRRFTLKEVLEEINKKLRAFLPTGIFCAAIAFEIDAQAGLLQVWNGGMHDLLLMGPQGDIRRLPSTHLALGILKPTLFDASLLSVPFEAGSQVLGCSDGVIEARRDGEHFGLARLEALLRTVAPEDDLIAAIRKALDDFTGQRAQDDDLTMVHVFGGDLVAQSAEATEDRAVEHTNRRPASTWRVSFDFEADTLRSSDPVLIALRTLLQTEDLADHRTVLHLILRELLSNALEHGLLRLDSSLKSSAEGFARYYDEREARLAKLESGQIHIGLAHAPTTDGGQLTIEVSDSGPGFDVAEIEAKRAAGAAACGRGITLVRKACRSLEYSDRGRAVQAVFEWSRHAKVPRA